MPRPSPPPLRPCRPPRRTHIPIEPLEPRTLLAANLRVDSVTLVDAGANPLPDPIPIGTDIFIRVDFTTTDLPANASYTISHTLYGITRTNTISWGAGFPGASSWWHYWGAWSANHSGPATATLTLDATNAVAESNESDNTASVSFTPVQLPLPAKFTHPLGGVPFRSHGFGNYADLDPTSPALADYRGGPYTYDGHDAIDIGFSSFRAMDDGVPVLAAAPATVLEAVDGFPDRNTVALGQPSNYVILDYGNGWRGYYYHLRNGSVGVAPGQTVAAGQVLGIVGSSGNSTGPHLHFATYNGDVIETYQDPHALWLNPLPYQGDVDQAIDAGIANYNFTPFLDAQERPPEHRTFSATPGQTVYAWFHAYHRPSASISFVYYRPNGTAYATVTFPAGPEPNRGGYWWVSRTLPNSPDLGTWSVAFLVDGVELRREDFTVTPGGSPTARVTTASTAPVPDARSSPYDAGTLPLNSSASPLSFTLTNVGTATLSLGPLAPPPGWLVDNALPASLAPGASDTFSLRPDTSKPGYRYGFASFTTNDPLSPTYEFALSAAVTPATSVPAVALVLRDPAAAEYARDPAVFRIHRTGGNTAAPLTVNLTRSGSASPGADFVPIPSSVTIPAGQTAVSVILTPVDDSAADPSETVTLSLAAGSYTLAPNSSATATVLDNDASAAASLSGAVYLDANFNTHRDAAEPPLAGVQLFLDYNHDNARQPAEPLATSDAAGAFAFTNLPAGRHPVRLLTPTHVLTTPVGDFSLAPSQSLPSTDFGAFPIAFTGTAGDDAFSLAPAPEPHRILITANGATYSALRSQLPSLSFTGAGGNDTLTLDATILTLPPGLLAAPPVTFTGNAGADTLKLVNTRPSDNLDVQLTHLTLAATTVNCPDIESILLDAPPETVVPLHSLTVLSRSVALPPGKGLVLALSSLAIDAGGSLDLADASLVLDYSGTPPVPLIRGYLLSGRNNGIWTGPGIISTLAAANPGHAIAYADAASLGLTSVGPLPLDGTALLLKYTRYGDANLSSTVTPDDTALTDRGRAMGLSLWTAGDFDYNSQVNNADLALLYPQLPPPPSTILTDPISQPLAAHHPDEKKRLAKPRKLDPPPTIRHRPAPRFSTTPIAARYS